MRTKQALIICAASCIIHCLIPKTLAAGTNVCVDPGPGNNFPASKHFTVKINGQPSFVYQNFKRDDFERHAYLKRIPMDSLSWTTVAADEAVTVEVTFLHKETINPIIRPKSLGITAHISGNTVALKLPAGRKVTVEDADDLQHVCFIFGHPEDPEPEGISPENIIRFKAGVHRLTTDPLILKSNQAVVLEPGAWVEGRIHGSNLKNVQILGRGNLVGTYQQRQDLKFGEGMDAKRQTMLMVLDGAGLRLQGPTLVDAPFWTLRATGTDPQKRNSISHMSILGWYVNADGFQNITYTDAHDLFTCTNDDSVPVSNIGHYTVERLVVWGMLAGAPLRLCWNCRQDSAEVIYHDVDVLHFPGNAAIISIQHGGPGNYRDVLIENLRIESPVRRLAEIEIKKNLWSPKNDTFGSISDITLRNVTAESAFAEPVLINGREGHVVKNITFENITIAGKKIQNQTDLNLQANEYTENIRVK